MKVWTKVRLKDYNKDIDIISKSLTNYVYGYGPIQDIIDKYNISDNDKHLLEQFCANRVAGLVMLYLAKDVDRINDIVNKYNVGTSVEGIVPEIEGYITKK